MCSSKHTFWTLFSLSCQFFHWLDRFSFFFHQECQIHFLQTCVWVVCLSCTVLNSSDQRVTVARLKVPINGERSRHVGADAVNGSPENKKEFLEEYCSLPKHSRNKQKALLIDILRGCVNNSVGVSTVQRDGAHCLLSTLRWNKWNMTGVQTGCSPGPGPTSEKLIGNLRITYSNIQRCHAFKIDLHTHTDPHRGIYWHVLSITPNLAGSRPSVCLSVYLLSQNFKTAFQHSCRTHTCKQDRELRRYGPPSFSTSTPTVPGWVTLHFAGGLKKRKSTV